MKKIDEEIRQTTSSLPVRLKARMNLKLMEVPMNTPILETDRLSLRPFREDDAECVFECWESDPVVAKYMFWTSHNDIEKTKEWIIFELGQIEKPDWYRFAIILKDTNELIGTALIYYEK